MQTMVIRIDVQAEDLGVRARSRAPRPVHQPAPAALLITADPPVHALPRHPEPGRGLIHRNTRRGLQDSAVASFSALHCPARGHRVNGGPAGRRMRLALPIIGAAPTHQGSARLREVRRGAAIPQGQNRYRRVLVPWLPGLQTGLARHL
jgi:hypothetical protein